MDPAKLKVVELRAELQQRGLDTKGNKPVLVERLRKALEQEVATGGQSKPSMTENVEENSEKGADAAKPPQTPKRSSRSSTMTTPTKVSTRNAPRTCTTPNSARFTSPSKVQHAETPPDVMPTITECAGQEQEEMKQQSVIQSPRKVEEKHEVDASQVEDTKPPQLEAGKEETKEDVEDKPTEVPKDPPIIKSPTKQSPQKETKKDPEVPVQEPEATEVSKVTENQHSPEPLEEKEVEDDLSSNKAEPEVQVPENDDKEAEMAVEDEEDSKVDESILDEEESPKPEEAPEKELNNSKEEKSEDIPMKEEELDIDEEEAESTVNEKVSPPVEKEETHEEQKEEKSEKEGTEDIEMAEDITEEVPKVQETEADMKTVSNEESTKAPDTEETQEVDNMETPDKAGAQDIEMADSKKQEETDKCVDRKRKRSPSPAEEPQMSPAPVIVEDEPEIDDSALTLSWYDSDLNLVIEKDGFFTATPLHKDGFLHMWAGARASYGFLHGKVYYEAKITEQCEVKSQDEEHTHALRLGWSALNTSMQLGEESKSYGYESTGKKCTNNEFVDYGTEFSKDDVIGCYLDATSEENIVLSYTINGKDQGIAFTVAKAELDNKPLFPHVLSKSCTFACNFGQENPWCEQILEGYVSIGNVESEYKVPGPRRPNKKEDCEIIMMCGLPGSGKTEWSMKYASTHPDKFYNVLGISSMINKMKNKGVPCKESYSGNWNILVENCARSLNTLLEMAPIRRRNYILDETNVYASAQRRKMKTFSGYQRKAVVVVPTEEEFKSRVAKHKPIDDTASTDSTLMEMKASFRAPVVGDSFDSVEWVELGEEDGKKVIEKYNKEGRDAGFGHQQDNKRRRMDKPDIVNKDNRDTRNNRDNRDHRRNNYSDRNRNPMWRGANHMGWRDRPQRGGHPRHGGGYGPPAIPWRGRGAPIPPLRGLDRRDRRTGDRGRGGRQGGWAQMNYQGSQQGGWGQQGNWSGGQSGGGWGQGWSGGQQWGGNWKGYGQGSYGQTNYNQQGYGNGNWSSWNQQYYNQQYWDQPQQTGQTTAAGGQATNTTESLSSASSGDSAATYSYPQEWQDYTEGYSSAQSVGADNQQYQRHE